MLVETKILLGREARCFLDIGVSQNNVRTYCILRPLLQAILLGLLLCQAEVNMDPQFGFKLCSLSNTKSDAAVCGEDQTQNSLPSC